jgi:hypothetical protein
MPPAGEKGGYGGRLNPNCMWLLKVGPDFMKKGLSQDSGLLLSTEEDVA